MMQKLRIREAGTSVIRCGVRGLCPGSGRWISVE
jgi:hypothetical protein